MNPLCMSARRAGRAWDIAAHCGQHEGIASEVPPRLRLMCHNVHTRQRNRRRLGWITSARQQTHRTRVVCCAHVSLLELDDLIHESGTCDAKNQPMAESLMKTITWFPKNALAAVLAIAMSGGTTITYAESHDTPAPQTQRGPGYGPGLDYGNGMMGGYGTAGGFGTGMMEVYGPDWRLYRDYTFNADSDEILRSDSHKAREIASYIDRNPSLRVGLDGSNEGNVLAVRHALIMAGVPSSKIQTGAYGDPQLRRDGRVAVLVSE